MANAYLMSQVLLLNIIIAYSQLSVKDTTQRIVNKVKDYMGLYSDCFHQKTPELYDPM